MSKKYSGTIGDLLNMFSDALEPSDVLSAKLMAQISSAITKERIRLHMSQKAFADYIGVAQSLVSRWENGNYNFSIKKLSEIAVKLNLDVNLVLTPFIRKDADAETYMQTGAKIYTFVPKSSPAPSNIFYLEEREEM